jgi:hypothetical protein
MCLLPTGKHAWDEADIIIKIIYTIGSWTEWTFRKLINGLVDVRQQTGCSAPSYGFGKSFLSFSLVAGLVPC